jgi:hypothetical protein
MNVAGFFERELQKRGLSFRIDAESGRHAVTIEDWSILISLENLQRDVASDGDLGRIARFVDAIVLAADESRVAYAADSLFWSLERNDHDPPPDYRVPLSDRLDRVLIHQSSDKRLLTWVSPEIIEKLNVSLSDASASAFRNLSQQIQEAKVEFTDIGGTRLGFIITPLAFKASLILAPNLKEVAGGILGWPLLAVVPDRNFCFLWDASHREFCGHVGREVVREYSQGAYPLSTEVYEISDKGIKAIGEFPVEA